MCFRIENRKSTTVHALQNYILFHGSHRQQVTVCSFYLTNRRPVKL